MNKSQQINEVVKKYESALNEYKGAQRLYKNVSNQIDQKNMTGAEALALMKARKLLSEVSKKFYEARAEYRTDMKRLIAVKAIERANEHSAGSEVLSDEALAMAILKDASKDMQGIDISIDQQEQTLVLKEGFGKTQAYKDSVKNILENMRGLGKLNPATVPILCVCEHTYEEHTKIEGCTKCSNQDCLCTEYEPKT